MNKRVVILSVLVMVALGYWLVSQNKHVEPSDSPLIGFLSDKVDPDQFESVVSGKSLTFPRDHGAHDGFRQEWWYFTGSLKSNQRQFGYQLTFFRFFQPTDTPQSDSKWFSDQTWLAHFAITDVHNNRFYFDEDITRQVLGVAGTTATPFGVWLNSWSVKQAADDCTDCLTLSLKAQNDSFGLDLSLTSQSAPLLQGDNGYSKKNESGEVASYYYSVPDLQTEGFLSIGENQHRVSGETWLDREWSSSILTQDQRGWDWIALHLSGNRKLMVFQVRSDDTPYRQAILRMADGSLRRWSSSQITMQPTGYWQSDQSNTRYPVRWSIQLNDGSETLTIDIKPAVKNQEMRLGFTYYEGLVLATLNDGSEGSGYMELTGYDVTE